jgi:hypothetical protein
MVYGGKPMNYMTFNEPNIVNYLKMKRLAQAGHTAHKNNRIIKKIFNTKPRVRSVGTPKLRWENGVNQDMETLGVKN